MTPNYELARAIKNNIYRFRKQLITGELELDYDQFALWLQENVTISSEGTVSFKKGEQA